jgi:hypothetical protein
MKKIVSLKIVSLLIIPILFSTLKSCTERDEEIYPEKNNPTAVNSRKKISDHKNTARDSIDPLPMDTANLGDPPIKSGTHWKTKKDLSFHHFVVRNTNK